jgi:hypothetical protein
MLPFTSDTFLGLFATYNAAIWPAQIVAYGLGLLVLALLVRPVPQGRRIISATLAAFWLWTGIAYHGLAFSSINVLAPAFAALFAVAGLLFAWVGVWRGRIDYVLAADARGIAGAGLMLFALFVYPLLNWLSGHAWPQMPVFGVTPCPTTLFTLGALLLARSRTPWGVGAIPFVWALIGTSAAWLLGVPEDLSLAAAAVIFVAAGLRPRAFAG